MVLSAGVLRPTRHQYDGTRHRYDGTRHRYDNQHDTDELAGRQRRASHTARHCVRHCVRYDGVVLRWRCAVTALCRSVRQLGYNGAAYVM